MILLLVKQALAVGVVALNAGLLVWAIGTFRRKGPLPEGYYRWLRISPLVAITLPLLGLFFLGRGTQVEVMHIFYGVLVTLGIAAQFLLSSRRAVAQKYRTRPLVHAFLALFVMLLTARSWMAV